FVSGKTRRHGENQANDKRCRSTEPALNLQFQLEAEGRNPEGVEGLSKGALACPTSHSGLSDQGSMKNLRKKRGDLSLVLYYGGTEKSADRKSRANRLSKGLTI